MVPVVTQEQHVESLLVSGGCVHGMPRRGRRPSREESERDKQGVLHKVGTTTNAVIRSVRKEIDAESSMTTARNRAVKAAE